MSEVQVNHWYYEQSTKDYDIWLLQSSNGRALVCRRWGKKGSSGQFKVTRHDVERQARAYIKKVVVTREKNGYQEVSANAFKGVSHSSSNLTGLMGTRDSQRPNFNDLNYIFSTNDEETSSTEPIMPKDKIEHGVENYGENSVWGSW